MAFRRRLDRLLQQVADDSRNLEHRFRFQQRIVSLRRRLGTFFKLADNGLGGGKIAG